MMWIYYKLVKINVIKIYLIPQNLYFSNFTYKFENMEEMEKFDERKTPTTEVFKEETEKQ